MRVLMTGGGTGGHVNPALAIAEIIKINQPGSEIAFVGTERGIENRLVPRAGYKLYHVNIRGIRRSLSPANIRTAFLVLTAPSKAKKIIEEFKPDIVIGTGGYACWPALKAAAKLGIPTAAHESNAIAGMAIKQLGDELDLIMTNFEETAASIKSSARVLRVGNPISGDFGRYTREQARAELGIPQGKTVILSCGGSLGAPVLNAEIFRFMRDNIVGRDDIMHFHARGRNEAEAAEAIVENYGLRASENISVTEYIYNMPLYMAAADIIVCRAGAMTLSEVAFTGRAAVIVPSPNVADNHQYKNAKLLADAGAALIAEEKDFSNGALEKAIKELIDNKALREDMAGRVGAFAKRDAGETIYREICGLLKK